MEESNIISVPLVTLRGIVVFPKLVSHIDIGRERSMEAVEKAMDTNRLLMVATQIDESEENPGIDGIYHIGTLVKIQQMLRMPGGGIRILVDGLYRAVINGFSERAAYLEVAVEEMITMSVEAVKANAFDIIMVDSLGAGLLQAGIENDKTVAVLLLGSLPR